MIRVFSRLSQKTCLQIACLILLIFSFYSPQGYSRTELSLSDKEREWLQRHQNISVAFDGYFPPYSFINDDGELEGVSIDVFNELSKKLGVTFTAHSETSWQSLYASAQSKKVDVVATMVQRPDRDQWFHFTEPYIFKSLVIVTQAENLIIESRADIASKKVALVESYQYVSGILKEFPDIQPYYVKTMEEGLRAVSTGMADAAITFLGAGHYIRTRYLLANLKYAAVYDIDSSVESIAVRSDWPELASILNKALNAIPEQKMQAFRQKWLPDNYQDILYEIKLTPEELAWIQNHSVIRVGVDPEFAPFEYIENERYSGMASDYLRLISERLNIQLEVQLGLSWSQVMDNAEQGLIDVLPAVGKTAERQGFLNYTKPYLKFYRVIITRSDTGLVLGIGDIDTLKVGVQANSSHHGFLKEKTTINPVPYDSLEETLLALSGGEVDAVVGNVASSTYWIRKLNLTNLKVAAPVSQDVQNLHFAVRKDWPELVSIIQKGLDSISPSQQKQISEKWLYIEYEPTLNYQLLFKIIAIASLVVSAILFWNIALNRKVKERSAALVRQAYYDPLTDLPNRFLIQDRLSILISEAKKSTHKLAMISVDLDEFKKINDTFSHKVGDMALVVIAKRLTDLFGDEYVIGRLGGDQFLIIVKNIEHTSEIVVIASSLLKSISRPIELSGQIIGLTASLGISIFPDDSDSPETLIQNADSATHHSKALAHGSYAFFTQKLNHEIRRSVKVEEQMRSALSRNEFYVVYQPKVEVMTGKVVSFEALVRWNNLELGQIYPDEFIPIAEKNGLIEPIGIFVLKTALKVLADLQKNFDANLTMAVNVSPRQFRSANLIYQIKEAVKSAQVSYESVELEITEGLLMSGFQNLDYILEEIKRLGITLAMDDFGTGYSSMKYLRRYAFNVLKVDREFITDLINSPSDQQLVSAIIAMAQNLGLKVVAEGVETQAHLNLLKQYGCDLAQGWLFGKPVTASDLMSQLQIQDKVKIAK